jgi:phosphate transport system substrate-binding protein
VSITSSAGGSAAGISAAAAGTVNIGVSDAPLSSAEMQQNPGLLTIPLTISAEVVISNVPGVTSHLKLDGAAISDMYQGTITNWNDPRIAALNPGTALPNLTIAPVHRSDSSDDTLWFTTFLAAADPSGWGQKVTPGAAVSWPVVRGTLSANGDAGVLQACQRIPGCISYVAINYVNQTTGAGLGYVALKNKAGNFENPTQATMSDAALGFASSTPANGSVSMIFGAASDAYPIVNYEYAIVRSKQSSPLAAQAVRALLAWSVDPSGGSAPPYLQQFTFSALPSPVIPISAKLVSQISS